MGDSHHDFCSQGKGLCPVCFSVSFFSLKLHPWAWVIICFLKVDAKKWAALQSWIQPCPAILLEGMRHACVWYGVVYARAHMCTCMCVDHKVTLPTSWKSRELWMQDRGLHFALYLSKALQRGTLHLNTLLSSRVWTLFPFPDKDTLPRVDTAPLHPSWVDDLAKVRGEARGGWDWETVYISACSITADNVSHHYTAMTSIQPRNLVSMGNSREFRARQDSVTLCLVWQGRGMPRAFSINQA